MINDKQGAPAKAETQSVPSALARAARYAPGLSLFRQYRREWLIGDVVAGISVCLIMIPSVIAYAGLMGLPPQRGLYAALVPLFIYALFGSSRQVIVGPDIAISLLIASTIAPLAAGDPVRAGALAAVVALLSGLLLVLGAKANLGAVADFFSKPVLVGYMTGAALLLVGSQLNKLFGVALERQEFFPRLAELAGKLPHTHGPTLSLGLSLLALLILLRRFAPRLPGALAVCVVAIVVSNLLGLPARGVTLVSAVSGGLPALVVPAVSWRDIQFLLPGAIAVALLTYTEGILLARAFAARNGYEVRANQELAALGLSDLAAGLFQGFSITGSQARTTVNDAAGGRTQLSGLVAAGALVLFLLFLTPLITRLPEAALAAILIYAGFGLIEFEVLLRIYRYYPRSSVLAALTTLSVLAAGVVPGILFGVALSLLGLVNRLAHPADAILSEVPGDGFHDLGWKSAAQTVPGLVVYRFYAPLLFPNAGHFLERIREVIRTSPSPVRWLLLDAQAITAIDVTAAETLQGLHRELRGQGIALKFAHANPPLRATLERIGLAEELGPSSFYSSVHECVNAFQGKG